MQLLGRAGASMMLATALSAGCTANDPEAAVTPRPTKTVAPATSPTATSVPTLESSAAPQPPAALGRMDEVGAVAAATYFADLYSYTLQSGEVSAWERISHTECAFCRGIRDDALAAKERGERYEGGRIALSNVVVLDRDESVGGYPVEAGYTQDPEVHRGADGGVIAETGSSAGKVRIDTLPTSVGWKILAVVVEGA